MGCFFPPRALGCPRFCPWAAGRSTGPRVRGQNRSAGHAQHPRHPKRLCCTLWLPPWWCLVPLGIALSSVLLGLGPRPVGRPLTVRPSALIPYLPPPGGPGREACPRDCFPRVLAFRRPGHAAAVSWPSCPVVVSGEPQTRAGLGPNVSVLDVWPTLCLGKKSNAKGPPSALSPGVCWGRQRTALRFGAVEVAGGAQASEGAGVPSARWAGRDEEGAAGSPLGPALLSAAPVHSCRPQGTPQHPGTSWKECASLSCARVRAAAGFPLEPRPPACLRHPMSHLKREPWAARGSALQGPAAPQLRWTEAGEGGRLSTAGWFTVSVVAPDQPPAALSALLPRMGAAWWHPSATSEDVFTG